MKKTNKYGFTLIELLVVVVIVAVLAAVAVPMYKRAVWKSRVAEVKVLADSLRKAESVYRLGNGEYPSDFSKLDIKL